MLFPHINYFFTFAHCAKLLLLLLIISLIIVCFYFHFRLLFFESEYHDAETEPENIGNSKTEDKSSLQNILSIEEQEPQLNEMQSSGQLLDLNMESTPIQSLTNITSTSVKCK